MIKALKYCFLINICSIATHLWSVVLLTVNDTYYNTTKEAMPFLIMGIAPTFFSSLIFMFVFSKKADFVYSRVLLLQFLVLFAWYAIYGLAFIENFKVFY